MKREREKPLRFESTNEIPYQWMLSSLVQVEPNHTRNVFTEQRLIIVESISINLINCLRQPNRANSNVQYTSYSKEEDPNRIELWFVMVWMCELSIWSTFQSIDAAQFNLTRSELMPTFMTNSTNGKLAIFLAHKKPSLKQLSANLPSNQEYAWNLRNSTRLYLVLCNS